MMEVVVDTCGADEDAVAERHRLQHRHYQTRRRRRQAEFEVQLQHDRGSNREEMKGLSEQAFDEFVSLAIETPVEEK